MRALAGAFRGLVAPKGGSGGGGCPPGPPAELRPPSCGETGADTPPALGPRAGLRAACCRVWLWGLPALRWLRIKAKRSSSPGPLSWWKVGPWVTAFSTPRRRSLRAVGCHRGSHRPGRGHLPAWLGEVPVGPSLRALQGWGLPGTRGTGVQPLAATGPPWALISGRTVLAWRRIMAMCRVSER